MPATLLIPALSKTPTNLDEVVQAAPQLLTNFLLQNGTFHPSIFGFPDSDAYLWFSQEANLTSDFLKFVQQAFKYKDVSRYLYMRYAHLHELRKPQTLLSHEVFYILAADQKEARTGYLYLHRPPGLTDAMSFTYCESYSFSLEPELTGAPVAWLLHNNAPLASTDRKTPIGLH